MRSVLHRILGGGLAVTVGVGLLVGLTFGAGVAYAANCPPTCTGSNGADSISGNSNNNTIDLLGGNDHGYGQGGNDTVRGGEDRDEVDGMQSDDGLITGGNGFDGHDGHNVNLGEPQVLGGGGNDSVLGGGGNDDVFGETGNDYMYGEEDDDEQAHGGPHG